MTPDRYALIKEVFLAALPLSPGERRALLDRRCEEDEELRREVERLLAHHDDQTITPGPNATTPRNDAWRQAGPQLELDDRASTDSVAAGGRQQHTSDMLNLEPGAMVAGRYRIVSRLGRGGMGVVYRAEDLTLGQTVALKFLNPAMAGDLVWLDRFRNEVRTAREVTHPNVCRVFDIGETDGRHFLSMEYVDGEDLTSLISRIGRLPQEKAIDVARQLCIGLAAAHGAGILHRDLKPANVMLDGRGRVRITDFGLAASPETIKAGEIRAGTPAYMAPEQISGREVGIRSDLYSLGLVLYELFTGRQAFYAESIEEYVELHQSAQPVPMSEIVGDVHPDVERIVDLCLRKDTGDRPASALAVAAALPGTDPLAAALAANQTPSPDTVAAANPAHGQVLSAGRLLLIVVALLVAQAVARQQAAFPWERPTSKPPAVLTERAQELIQRAGYTTKAADVATGFCEIDQAMALGIGRLDVPVDASMLAVDTGSNLIFWYRQSSERLTPSDVQNLVFGSGQVTPSDPMPVAAGQVSVALDLTGRLLLFSATPDRDERSADKRSTQIALHAWDPFLELAGLDGVELTALKIAHAPLLQADQSFAWHGPNPSGAQGTIRVDASAQSGRPVFFAVRMTEGSAAHGPWRDLRRRKATVTTSLRLLLLAMTGFAVPWAWRNFRTGRGDRRGALCLAVFAITVELAVWLLRARHVFEFNAELLLLCVAGMRALGVAALLAIFYIALEPFARRHWPQMLIAWSRAVSGRWRDPLVGGQMLIGVCVGCFWALAFASERAVVNALGWEVRYSVAGERFADKLISSRAALASYLEAVPQVIVQGLLFLLLLAALRAAVGRSRWAAVLSTLVLLPIVIPRGAHLVTGWLVMGVGGAAVAVWVMTRFGFVTLTTALFVAFVLNTSPITLDFSAWYADVTVCAFMIVAAITAYAFSSARLRTSPNLPAPMR